ncbi:hypothetical protein D3C76_1663240 [compost metagenome]
MDHADVGVHQAVSGFIDARQVIGHGLQLVGQCWQAASGDTGSQPGADMTAQVFSYQFIVRERLGEDKSRFQRVAGQNHFGIADA